MDRPSVNIRRVGVFGGTFNPVHRGHVYLAENAVQLLGLDLLLMVPTASPPHKEAPGLKSGWSRMMACAEAVDHIPQAAVSGIDVDRGGKSYTVYTLEQVSRDYPGAELFLITGGDMLMSFLTWKNVPKILSMATLFSIPRDAFTRDNMAAAAAKITAAGGRVLLAYIPFVEISSTQLRLANVEHNESM